MTCLLCQDRRPCSRGLCLSCYHREYYAGRIADWPRSTFTRAELLAEWDMLRRQGHTRKQAAERLGVTESAINQALSRERRARVAT